MAEGTSPASAPALNFSGADDSRLDRRQTSNSDQHERMSRIAGTKITDGATFCARQRPE